jgi:hypothetical protein
MHAIYTWNLGPHTRNSSIAFTLHIQENVHSSPCPEVKLLDGAPFKACIWGYGWYRGSCQTHTDNKLEKT